MVWKAYVDCSDYEVSDEGEVRRVVRWLPRGRRTPYLLGQRHGNNPYRYVSLSIDGVPRNVMVHRMVLRTFVGEPPTEAHEAAHADGNPLNNRLANLMWATKSENNQHKRLHGTYSTPKRLTETDVIAMRALYRDDENISFQAVAQQFGVSAPTAGGVITGRYWSHIPGAVPSKSKGRKRV